MSDSQQRPEFTAHDARNDRMRPDPATTRRRITDRRTTLGRTWHHWRHALIEDLGGLAALSTQQLALVDLAANTKMLIEVLDRRLLADPALLDGGRCRNVVVLRERDRLATTFAMCMTALGLRRRRQAKTTLYDEPDPPMRSVAGHDHASHASASGAAALGTNDGDR